MSPPAPLNCHFIGVAEILIGAISLVLDGFGSGLRLKSRLRSGAWAGLECIRSSSDFVVAPWALLAACFSIAILFQELDVCPIPLNRSSPMGVKDRIDFNWLARTDST